MIAPETGFPTAGSLLMKAEIPVGWHTGRHFHGEEAIYVEQGEGFLALDEKAYAELPDDKVLELHRNGLIALIEMHRLSLGNMNRLVGKYAA